MTLEQQLARVKIKAQAGERWRLVNGWPEYAVSSHGRVVVRERVITSARHTCTKKARLLSPWITDDGHTVRFSRDGHRETHPVDRLVIEAFGPPRPVTAMRLCPLHVDGNAYNDKIENLRWGTPGAEMRVVTLTKMIAEGQRGSSASTAGARAGAGAHHTHEIMTMLRLALQMPPRTPWPKLAALAVERKLNLLDVVASRAAVVEARG